MNIEQVVVIVQLIRTVRLRMAFESDLDFPFVGRACAMSAGRVLTRFSSRVNYRQQKYNFVAERRRSRRGKN